MGGLKAALLARAWIHVLGRYLQDQDEERLHLRMRDGRLHLFNDNSSSILNHFEE